MGVVAKIAFVVLRVAVGIGALAAFAATGLVVIVYGFFNLAKAGFVVARAIAVSVASAFQKSPPPSPDLSIPLPLFGLMIFFLTMFFSVFTPGQRIFLHVVAGMVAVAEAWELWRYATIPQTKILYLPVILLWGVYYLICLGRA